MAAAVGATSTERWRGVSMHEQELRARLEQVRRRWLLAEGALALAKALAVSALLVGTAWALSVMLALSGGPLVTVTALTGAMAVALMVWALWPLRVALPPERLARYIEEKCPGLEDRVVSAVQVLEHPGSSPFESLVLRDAASRLSALDIDRIVESRLVRRRVLWCGAATLAFLAVVAVSRDTISTAARTAWYTVFPPTLSLLVEPGNARIRAGEPFTVLAVLSGSAADLEWGDARLVIGHGDAQRATEASGDGGRYRWEIPSVDESLEYQVKVGGLASDWFRIEALNPARVTRIDLAYEYPSFSGLGPRVEEDTGDIYAPQGTAVTLSVSTDKPVDTATLALAGGNTVVLSGAPDGTLRGNVQVTQDSAYRVALIDKDGLENPGDTEYFIRVMDDRPPEVKVSRPGGDRQVTRLEEVAIEVRADDDYGIDQVELVYSVSGQTEKVVQLHRGRSATTVTGRDVLFVEDLDVKPGDFVTYYARARDIGRGKSPSVSQSDIFFLDVRPFSEEFVAAQSQAGGGGSMSGGQLEELITAQKDIIVATWKVERRAAAGRSADDVKAIQRAQGEVRKKVAQAAGEAGRGAGSRRRPSQPAQPAQPDSLADPLQRAVESMGKAEAALGVIKTTDALPHEMDALNRLLEAQAENTRRQVTQQNGGGGSGQQGQNQDLSALFDRELLRQTETNYETEKSARPRDEKKADEDDTLDKLRELARRQDDLARQQRELAKKQDGIAREELKRQLEKLTRDQAELRQEAERLAEQMARDAQSASASQQRQDGEPAGEQSEPSGQQSNRPTGQQQSGQQQSGQQSGQQAGRGQRAGQQGQQQAAGQPSGQQAGQRTNGAQANQGTQGQSEQLRQASEQMRNATGELRRSELEQAAERSQQAVDHLRELERQIRALQPDEQRRQLGELQLEARQLAESQRRLANESGRQGAAGGVDAEARRRLASEQRGLAERAEQLEQALAGASAPDATGRQSLSEAAREMDQRRLPERMRDVSEAISASGSSGANQPSGTSQGASNGKVGKPGQPSSTGGRSQEPGSGAEPRAEQQELASALDRVADKVSSALGRDAESRQLSEKLAELRGLRERLSELERRMEEAAQRASEANASGQQGRSSGREPGQSEQGGQQPGGQASPDSPSANERASARAGGDGQGGTELGRLQSEYARELQQTEAVLEQLRQENPSLGGQLASLEQHYYSRSAPGTEAFKQDFARWDVLRRDVQQALERLEGSLANRLAERDSRQRLNVGGDDPLPETYRKQISDYYRSLVKRPGGSS